ncbi:MAG: hypothetical protein D6811_01525 [Alphaproteobacteria bacterium]|nr:MAG: hypothetical protein D6811_01525 [Alphaproteobacteria bacterium]
MLLAEVTMLMPREDARDVLLAPGLWRAARAARGAHVVDDGGRWRAGVAVIPDGAGRCWISGWRAWDVKAPQLRPLLRWWRGGERERWREVRAWIAADDARAKRFAAWCGLRYDCGPASGISPAGRDMELWRS